MAASSSSSSSSSCHATEPMISYISSSQGSSDEFSPRQKIHPLSFSQLPKRSYATGLQMTRSSSTSSDDMGSPDSSEGKTSKAVTAVFDLAKKMYVETRPHLLREVIPNDQSVQDYIRTHFIPTKSLSKKPKTRVKLIQSVHDYIVGQGIYIEKEHIISDIIKNEHFCVLKQSYESIRKTTSQFFQHFPEAESSVKVKKKLHRRTPLENKSTKTFVKNFNRYDKLRDEYIEKAIDALIKTKEQCWEYINGVKVRPIPEEVPMGRKVFFEMYFCDDLEIKEMALHYLIELLECDPLTTRTADELIDLQRKLLEEINENKVQNRTILIQRLLIKAYSTTLECILLHYGQRHLNGIIDEFKHEIWTGASNLSDLNVNEDEEIKFWTEYAIQGAQRIETNVSFLFDILNRLILVIKAGIRIASAINSPQEGAQALADAYDHLYQAIWHIRWQKDWFDLVLTAKKLCRYTMHDVQAFRFVIDFVQQIKREESGYKLFYGIVSSLEYVISKSVHPEIQEEGLKLLLQYMTVDNIKIKERVVVAFAQLVEFNDQGGRLQNTSYNILKLLESTEEDMRRMIQSVLASFPSNIIRKLDHQKRVFESTDGDLNNYIFPNALKFLIRRLAEIKDEEDFGGHSFVTMLTSSNEDRITPALLTALKMISPHFLKPDVYGNTPYHVSVRKGNPQMIDYINKGMAEIPINFQNYDERDTALHLAVKIGESNCASYLIKLEVDLNIQNFDGNTPLHVAVERKNIDIITRLLNGDCNPNLVNNKGETPLNIALKNDDVHIVRLLMDKGGDVAEQVYHSTPIIVSAQMNAEKSLRHCLERVEHHLTKLECLEILKMISQDRQTMTCSIEFARNHYLLMSTNPNYQESFKPFCIWPKLAMNDSNEIYLNVEKIVTRCQAFENSELIQLVTGESNLKQIKKLISKDPEMVNKPNHLLITPLHGAVAKHNYEAVKYLIISGADVNCADASGFTPLHFAVFVNDEKIVQILLDNGADPNARNNYGETPFLMHAGNIPNRTPSNIYTVLSQIERFTGYNSRILELLSSKGAMANIPDFQGNYALHHALLYGTMESIFNIMNNHSDLLLKSEKRWFGNKNITPLEEAALANNKESISTLLNMLTDDDLAALEEEFYHNEMISISLGNILALIDDAENFERLVRKKPSIAYQSDHSNDKLTPIHVAGKYNFINILNIYLKLGLKLDAQDVYNNTIAHHAAKHGNFDIILELIKTKKFNFNTKNYDGRTPLHKAVTNNHYNIFELILLSYPKLVMEKDGCGDTSLHLACRKNYFEMVKLIIDTYPSAISSINDDGNTPIHLAAARDSTCQTLHYLLNKMAQYSDHSVNAIHVDTKNAFGETAFLLAAQQGHLDSVRLLHTRGADILAQDDEKESALHKAVFNNHSEVVRELLSRDVNISQERKLVYQKDIRGEVPLHEIAKKRGNDMEMARKNEVLCLLLNAGSDLNAKSESGETVLHSIGSYGNLGLLMTIRDWLKETKSNLKFNIEDNHGDTPLHKACYNNHAKIIPLMMELNIDLNSRNKKGQTPLHIAIEQNHMILSTQLIEIHRAKLKIKDNLGRTLLHYLLLEKPMTKKITDLIRLIIQKKPSLILLKDTKDETIFHYIARHNHLDAFDLIISTLYQNDLPVSDLLWEKNSDGQAAYDVARDLGNVNIRLKIQNYSPALLNPNPDHIKSEKKCVIV